MKRPLTVLSPVEADERLDRMLADPSRTGAPFDGVALRSARRLLGLTQYQAAAVLAVSPGTLRSWETGEALPRRQYRPALGRFIARAEALMNGEGR